MTESRCTRCHRKVAEPVVIAGRGYGPTCALKVRPARGGRVRAARPVQERDERQGDLFAEVGA